MHANICEFPSETLYSSKLTSHESVASHLLDDLPNTFLDSEDAKEVLQTPIVFFDTSGCEYFERVDSTDGDEGSRCNENEATIVSSWVDKLVSVIFGIHLSALQRLSLFNSKITYGVLSSQIAIITPCVNPGIGVTSNANGFIYYFRYQAQVVLLTSLLRPKYGPELEIGTVDGMQGREKEAVVISLVRSNDVVSYLPVFF